MQKFNVNSSVNLPVANLSLSTEKLASVDLQQQRDMVQSEEGPDAPPLPGCAEAGRKSGFLCGQS